MELQKFEIDYLFNKDLSYFEDYNMDHKSTPHVYVADDMQEIQDTLQELNLPRAMVYNSNTDQWKDKRNFMFYLQLSLKLNKFA